MGNLTFLIKQYLFQATFRFDLLRLLQALKSIQTSEIDRNQNRKLKIRHDKIV